MEPLSIEAPIIASNGIATNSTDLHIPTASSAASSLPIAKAIPLTCIGHSRPVTHLCFSGLLTKDRAATDLQNDLINPRYLLISACKDGNPILRNGVTGDWIGTYLGHKGAIWCTRISKDGTLAASSGADFSANLWNSKTGELLVSLPHKQIVRSCDLSPGASLAEYSSARLITGSQDSSVKIWNITEKSVDLEWSIATTGPDGSTTPQPIRSALWISKDTIVTVTFEGLVTWWKLIQDSHTVEKQGEIGLKGTTRQVEFNDTHNQLIIASGKTGYFIDASTREIAKTFAVDYNISAMCVDKENTWIVTGSADDLWVHVYSYDSGKLLETLKGHHGPVHAASFSPDNALLATGSEDGTIRMWKTEAGAYGLWLA